MSKKSLSFLEQATALEQENKELRESLNNYQKLADLVFKAELGMDLKSVKKALANVGESQQKTSNTRHFKSTNFEDEVMLDEQDS